MRNDELVDFLAPKHIQVLVVGDLSVDTVIYACRNNSVLVHLRLDVSCALVARQASHQCLPDYRSRRKGEKSE